MSDLTATLKLSNGGTIITLTREGNEIVLSIDHGKEASVARLNLKERGTLAMLLSATGALG